MDYFKKIAHKKNKQKRNNYNAYGGFDRPPNSGYTLEELENRRISTYLELIISKIAEDDTGDVIDGDDYWNVDKLMKRKFSKEI